ncbi:hypothetical protein PRIPAC_85001 [Pristionchus pacificus]|uniref:Uncharacterized protein n=1 Tax=Pristionchus pacificus TaxID=54126 RepID=A0A2A6CIS2_PRIPA|nr:hypothetical protein PRIPAC_85001 [Pristionchus pacificus]|eukprot:PDM78000.1 hypothetical protein PRIPAC_35189 [Pristionchus pacificus]
MDQLSKKIYLLTPIVRQKEEGNIDDEEGGESSGDEVRWKVRQRRNTWTCREGELAMDEDDAVLNWKEEVDRVTPLLKSILPDGKDWRIHMNKMVRMMGNMDKLKGVAGGKIIEQQTQLQQQGTQRQEQILRKERKRASSFLH